MLGAVSGFERGHAHAVACHPTCLFNQEKLISLLLDKKKAAGYHF